jgi:hypothetical protein
MIEDEELRGLPEPDEAQKAAAVAAFKAWEEEWQRERDTLSPASPPPLGRAGKGRV